MSWSSNSVCCDVKSAHRFPRVQMSGSGLKTGVGESMSQLTVVNGVSVMQLEPGMYRLNDLHRAAVLSGANERTKEPGKFLSAPKTKIIISSIQREDFKKVHTVRGGSLQGTFVCVELLIAYSMWVDTAFYAKVLHNLSLVDPREKGASQ